MGLEMRRQSDSAYRVADLREKIPNRKGIKIDVWHDNGRTSPPGGWWVIEAQATDGSVGGLRLRDQSRQTLLRRSQSVLKAFARAVRDNRWGQDL